MVIVEEVNREVLVLNDFVSGILLGDMGSGKTTFIKNFMMRNLIQGNFVRGIEFYGEYKDFVDHLGGRYVVIDGGTYALNPLHVYLESPVLGDDLKWQQESALALHFDRVTKFYSYFSHHNSFVDSGYFKNVLREFYKSIGFIREDGRASRVTGLVNEAYPILSDFLGYIQKELKIALGKSKKELEVRSYLGVDEVSSLSRMVRTVTDIINRYPDLFNRHTNFPDFKGEPFLVFRVDRHLKSVYGESAFDAQVFNLLGYLKEDLIRFNEEIVQSSIERYVDADLIKRSLLVIDAGGNFFKPDQIEHVNFLMNYLDDLRENYGQVLLSDQSIDLFVPKGSDGAGKDRMKELLVRFNTKIIMSQSRDSVEELKQVFNSCFLPEDYSMIAEVEGNQGRLMVIHSGLNKGVFQVVESEESRSIGYMGNKHDWEASLVVSKLD